MEAKTIITLYCSLCERKHDTTFMVPAGWDIDVGIDAEKGFCPDHSIVKVFSDSQCPGCVGGWGECGLFKAFAFSRNDLTPYDHMKLRAGYCPKRTNGTFSMTAGRERIEDIDLSEQAPNAAGAALSDAIKAYVKRYPEKG